MKKIIISRLWLYQHRFAIGYTMLGVALVAFIATLPLTMQQGLTEAEMESAVSAHALQWDAIVDGDLVDLPYRLLQKLSISLLGLTVYAIKLPSLLLGLVLGLLLMLLLNRWFKNNVSLLASCLVVLSTPFLVLAGTGTPLIMLVLWPTLLLWLGSKIQGEKKPRPAYCFLFALALLLAIFTPYMLYFAVLVVGFVALQPHLRFVIKRLPRGPLIITGLVVLAGVAALIANSIYHPATLAELLTAKDFAWGEYWSHLGQGLAPALIWQGAAESTVPSPLINLPLLALAAIGLLSTTKGFLASRNSMALALIMFALLVTGFSPEAVILLLLPLTILIAHGLKYLLEQWYGLFPKNPYARVGALVPLSVLFGLMMVPSLLHFVYGYRYSPSVAGRLDYSLSIIHQRLTDEALLVGQHYEFYKILEESTQLQVVSSTGDWRPSQLAVLGSAEEGADVSATNAAELTRVGYALSHIITSPMREKSDIIYIYTEKGE